MHNYSHLLKNRGLEICGRYSLISHEAHQFVCDSEDRKNHCNNLYQSYYIIDLMNKLKVEDDKLNQELEESHGDFDKMKLVFEKRIDLFNRFLKKEGLTDLDKLMLENKREWNMSHLLSLIINEETTLKIRDLTKRVYQLEKAAQLE
jgi:hypothetical protein